MEEQQWKNILRLLYSWCNKVRGHSRILSRTSKVLDHERQASHQHAKLTSGQMCYVILTKPSVAPPRRAESRLTVSSVCRSVCTNVTDLQRKHGTCCYLVPWVCKMGRAFLSVRPATYTRWSLPAPKRSLWYIYYVVRVCSPYEEDGDEFWLLNRCFVMPFLRPNHTVAERAQKPPEDDARTSRDKRRQLAKMVIVVFHMQ